MLLFHIVVYRFDHGRMTPGLCIYRHSWASKIPLGGGVKFSDPGGGESIFQKWGVKNICRQGKLLCFRVYSRNEGEWGQNFRSIIKIFIKKVFKTFPKTWGGLKILASWGGSYPPSPHMPTYVYRACAPKPTPRCLIAMHARLFSERSHVGMHEHIKHHFNNNTYAH